MILEALGDHAVRFAIPDGIDRAALLARLRAVDGAVDAVVTETHAMVRFAGATPPAIDVPSLTEGLDRVGQAPREHAIEVVYDGPDLDEVAALAGLDRDQVIALHEGAMYRVSFVGFLPGFAYLRGLDPQLAAVARRATPRTRVEPGSVAIAGGFTGVYPFASPGGWRLLGRAPGFRPLEGEHARLALGDRVRFVRVA